MAPQRRRRSVVSDADYRGNRMASASAVALTGTSSGATDGGGADPALIAIGMAMPRGIGCWPGRVEAHFLELVEAEVEQSGGLLHTATQARQRLFGGRLVRLAFGGTR